MPTASSLLNKKKLSYARPPKAHRRSAILRLEAVGISSSERNLCVNFGQAQIRHNGFEKGDILLYFSADD
jgi:hypothetical protein